MSIYLFALYIKLFGYVDSFVLDIFFLFILCNQMFGMFNVLFDVHYYLFVMFIFFIKRIIFFTLLKYLFSAFKTNYLILKKYFLKKYRVNIGKCGLILKIFS